MKNGIQDWIADLSASIAETHPELLKLFNIYAAEALFGRRFIEADLAVLSRESKILELGAGALILSCQLVREGFQVVSVEPVADGFCHLGRLRELVMERAQIHRCAPKVLQVRAENLNIKNCFDYAFSVNVMEHVSNVGEVIEKVWDSLNQRATYRFTSPNYTFPYEPHFNIPVIFTKKITERLYWGRIISAGHLPDPIGTWRSLNWITVSTVRRIAQTLPGCSVKFNRSVLFTTLERITYDEQFASRRSPWLSIVIKTFVKLKIHYAVKSIPASLQPVIDCSMTKRRF